jgi:hypothetical protein
MKRAIFFVLLITISILSNAQNLIINPGLESWGKVNKPAGWTHIENCLKDSVVVNSGNYSCMHSGGAASASDLGQNVSVTPGKQYILSLYYMSSVSSSGNGARIWCYWKDINGSSLTDPASDAILRPSKYMKSDSWQQMTISITSPPGAASFYIEVRTYPNSIAYWDDFKFEETFLTENQELWPPSAVIYPVPASDNLIVSNISDLKHIDIRNMSGLTVWSSDFSGETSVTIPVAGLADGMYILDIYSSDITVTRRFIKN